MRGAFPRPCIPYISVFADPTSHEPSYWAEWNCLTKGKPMRRKELRTAAKRRRKAVNHPRPRKRRKGMISPG